MNEKETKIIKDRISELTKKYEANREEITRLQRIILQSQQELARLNTLDQSLRGGISELNRLLKS